MYILFRAGVLYPITDQWLVVRFTQLKLVSDQRLPRGMLLDEVFDV